MQTKRNSTTLNYATTHQTLIEECKLGSRQAQFELYKLYAKAMYNVCLRMVRNEMDAEDILQQSFVDVFSKLESFRYQAAVGAWIKRIVVNNCINFLRQKRLLWEELSQNHIDLRAEDDEEVDVSLTVDRVKRAMMKLPDGYRVVFSLYLLEGYDHAEISEILGITEATSKSQFSRAKQRVRQLLETDATAG